MLKRIALVSTFSTTFYWQVALFPQKMGLNLSLPEPRPTTNESSYAMKVATAIQTTARCLGCKDTILWQDEKAMASSASFDTRVVTREEYKAANEYEDRIKELNKAGEADKRKSSSGTQGCPERTRYRAKTDKWKWLDKRFDA